VTSQVARRRPGRHGAVVPPDPEAPPTARPRGSPTQAAAPVAVNPRREGHEGRPPTPDRRPAPRSRVRRLPAGGATWGRPAPRHRWSV